METSARLQQNSAIAAELRQRFADDGIFVVNLVSTPGVEGAVFLERTLMRLEEKYQAAVLTVCNHADRLARSGAAVRQIVVSPGQLDAKTVRDALNDWLPHPLDFLFLENTHSQENLDLGEDLRVAPNEIALETSEGFEQWIQLLIARYDEDKAESEHPSDVALNDPSVKVVDANWVRHL